MGFLNTFNKLKKENNLSMTAISKNTGIPITTLSNYINRGSLPGCEQLILLANYFNVSIDYLAGRDLDVRVISKGGNLTKNESEKGETTMNLGENLKRIRLENGKSLIDVEKDTGINNPNLSRWEHGNVSPNIDFCIKLADYYGVTLDELVGRDSDVRVVSKSGNLTKNESEILSIFTMLDEVQQNRVIGYAYALAR